MVFRTMHEVLKIHYDRRSEYAPPAVKSRNLPCQCLMTSIPQDGIATEKWVIGSDDWWNE